MAEGSSQYKSSTEQERIIRQVERDLERSSSKREISQGTLSRRNLSQSTRRVLDNPETRDWVRSIINQKAAQNAANNFSLDRTTVKVSKTSRDTPLFVEDSTQGTISSNATGGGDENAGGGGGGGVPVLPEGQLGDLFYHNGETWVALSPPEDTEPDEEVFFYWNGSWNFAEVVVFNVCENGEAKTYRIPAIENTD